MSSDDARKYEVFLKGENPLDAFTKFKDFVTRTGGTREDATHHNRDLFEQWLKDLKDGEVGILLTRRRIGGAMKARAFSAARISAELSPSYEISPLAENSVTKVEIKPGNQARELKKRV